MCFAAMLQPAWIVSPGYGVPREASHCGRFKDDIEGCCVGGHHRKLAVCSILCGCPCLGILALINSVKVLGHHTLLLLHVTDADLPLKQSLEQGERVKNESKYE